MPIRYNFQKRELERPPFDFSLTGEDITKALEIRAQEKSELIDQNPVFKRALETLQNSDSSSSSSSSSPAPTAAASSSSSSSSSASSCGVNALADRAKNAMSALTSNLSAMRSKQPSHFQQAVPPTEDESRIRATVEFDAVNPSVLSQGDKKKTTISATALPLVPEAAAQRRHEIMSRTKVKIDSNDKPQVAIQVKARLTKETTQEQAQEICDIIKCLIPKDKWPVDETSDPVPKSALKYMDICVAPSSSVKHNNNNNNNNQADDKDDEGRLCLLFTFGIPEKYARDAEPLEKILTKVVSRLTNSPKGSELEDEIKSSVPQLFRFLTAKIELPSSLGEWLQEDHACWTRLLEGARVAIEGVWSSSFLKSKSYNKLVQQILTEFLESDAVAQYRLALGRVGSLSFVGDVGIDIKATPPELAFAQTVREGARALRKYWESADPQISGSGFSESAVAGRHNFSTSVLGTGAEAAVASFMGSNAFMGAHSSFARQNMFRNSSIFTFHSSQGSGSSYDAKETEPRMDFENMPSHMPTGTAFWLASLLIEKSANHLFDVSSASYVGRTFEVNVRAEGLIDRKLIDWFPKSRQEHLRQVAPHLTAQSKWCESADPNPRVMTSKIHAPKNDSVLGTKFGIYKQRFKDTFEMLWSGHASVVPRSVRQSYRLDLFSLVEQLHPKRSVFTVLIVVANRTRYEYAQLLAHFGVAFAGSSSDAFMPLDFDRLKTYQRFRATKQGPDLNSRLEMANSDDEDDEYRMEYDSRQKQASALKSLQYSPLRLKNLPKAGAGGFRTACCVRRSDNRAFQFILSNETVVDTFAKSATARPDGVIFFGRREENEPWFESDFTRSLGSSEIASRMQTNVYPICFVSTDTHVKATKENLGYSPEAIMQPRAVGYFDVPPADEKTVGFSCSEANAVLDFLVENAELPENGTSKAEKTSALDFPVEDNVMFAL